MSSQWNSRSRKKNSRLLRKMHLERPECSLLSNECNGNIELHHILGGAYGRADDVSNIVSLCRHHHHLITLNDYETRVELGEHLLTHRLDVIEYVRDRLGPISGDEWLERRLFIEVQDPE